MAIEEAAWKSYFDPTSEMLSANSFIIQYITTIVCMPEEHQREGHTYAFYLPFYAVLKILTDSPSFYLILVLLVEI